VVATGNYYFRAPEASGPFPTVAFEASRFVPRGPKNTVFLVGGVGTAFGYQVPFPQQFTLGGPGRLSAYSRDEFAGTDYFIVSGGVLHTVGHMPTLIGNRLMVTSFAEFGGAGERFGSTRFVGDISLAGVAETVIGPIAVGVSMGDQGRRNLFVSIGQLF
jgi:NTE family protein